jgi:hypothetical protein
MKTRKHQRTSRKIPYSEGRRRSPEEYALPHAKPPPIPSHTEIYVSPDGRSISAFTEQKQVSPGRISYSIQESSVYRNTPFLPGKKTRRKKHHHKKNRS